MTMLLWPRALRHLGLLAVFAGCVLIAPPGTRAAADPAPVPSAAAATPGRADLDPANDFVVGPPDWIPDCEARLRAAGVSYRPASLPVRRGPKGIRACGAEQAIMYRSGPAHIRYGGPLILSCGMALALARFETILSEEARRDFGRPVVRISHLGTYNCRTMARYPDWVSEHSYANAIDIESFTLENGRKISVLGSFGKEGREPQRSEARFLETLAHRLYDEEVFSVVITPRFDALHKNHFHLDLARYRVDGSR
jgi:hypothetical protein